MKVRAALILALVAYLAAPLAAEAQQPALPVIGYLSSRSPGDSVHIVAAFRQGLKDSGFVEGQNVAIEYRFAEGHADRLPSLASELVRRPVNVVVATGGTSSSVAAKPVVPATIPMVFAMGGDPVRLGIVPSLARPGGNITGVSFLISCRRSTDYVSSSRRVVSSAMAPASPPPIVSLGSTSRACSRGRNRPTCPSSNRPRSRA